MERKSKIYITSVIILFLLALTLIMALFNQVGLLIIIFTLLIVVSCYMIVLIIENSSSKNVYNKELKYILKTYKNILVKSLDLIDLRDKNIIRTDNIEDLVNAQVEVRKPIYYKCYANCTTFILLLDKEALLYVIKETDEVSDPTEYFTDESNLDLDEIIGSKTITYRNKKIKIEVIDNEPKKVIDEEKIDTQLEDFKNKNKRKKKNNRDIL